jgi:hypothetical protein
MTGASEKEGDWLSGCVHFLDIQDPLGARPQSQDPRLVLYVWWQWTCSSLSGFNLGVKGRMEELESCQLQFLILWVERIAWVLKLEHFCSTQLPCLCLSFPVCMLGIKYTYCVIVKIKWVDVRHLEQCQAQDKGKHLVRVGHWYEGYDY